MTAAALALEANWKRLRGGEGGMACLGATGSEGKVCGGRYFVLFLALELIREGGEEREKEKRTVVVVGL